jgi:hypothetical protein
MQAPTYYAQVLDGIVIDVRKTTRAFITDHPDRYAGTWIRVPSLAQYPAIDWTHDGTRFSPQTEIPIEETSE